MCLTSFQTFQKYLLNPNLIFWPKKWMFEISVVLLCDFLLCVVCQSNFSRISQLWKRKNKSLECVWLIVIHSRHIYWVKKKISFFDSKNGFSKFLRSFLTHFDIQTLKNDPLGLLWRSRKNFQTFNQKSARYVCSEWSGD